MTELETYLSAILSWAQLTMSAVRDPVLKAQLDALPVGGDR